MITKESKTNFTTLQRAFSRGDIALVSCTDSDLKTYQVICVLSHDETTTKYRYIPFAIMVSPIFYSFVNELIPPDQLIGEWKGDNTNESTSTKGSP